MCKSEGSLALFIISFTVYTTSPRTFKCWWDETEEVHWLRLGRERTSVSWSMYEHNTSIHSIYLLMEAGEEIS